SVVAAAPDVEAARLERRAVARGGELAVGALGGNPGLDVELACGARAEVARGGVDHAIRQTEALQHPLLHREQTLVLGLGIRGVDVAEHLELLELVHADDAARVLAVAARLAAVAGRPAGVAKRT